MSNRIIHARVSQKFISKVDRLFKGDLKTSLIELIQNSRRAGATHVNVTTEYPGGYPLGGMVTITIEDNGTGLNDPQLLLDLGESQWEDGGVADEDPAGMGFNSLAPLCKTPVEVRSHDWAATIPPGAFLGAVGVEVVTTEEFTKGMWIRFTVPLPQGHNYTLGSDRQWIIDLLPIQDRWLGNMLYSIARYAELKVLVGGRELQSEDFMERAIACRVFKGTRIGVMAMPNNNQLSSGGLVNFHGMLLSTDLAIIQRMGANNLDYRLRVDISHSEGIRMTLPQRDHLIEGEALEELKKAAKDFLFETAMKQSGGVHRMRYLEYRKWREAGYDLPEAIPQLRTAVVNNKRLEEMFPTSNPLTTLNDKSTYIRADAVEGGTKLNLLLAWLHSLNGDKSIQTLADGNVEAHELLDGPVLVGSNTHYSGYSWYDKLDGIDSMVLTAKQGNNTLETELLSHVRDRGALDGGLVDSITLTVTTDSEKVFTWDMPFAFMDGATVIVSKGEELTQHDADAIVDLGMLIWSIDNSDDDYEEDDRTLYNDLHRQIGVMRYGASNVVQEEIRKVLGDAILGLYYSWGKELPVITHMKVTRLDKDHPVVEVSFEK